MSEPPQELGPLSHKPKGYGFSENGIRLEVFGPANASTRILVMASIHGDESLSTVLLSECLRALAPDELSAAVILAANPDGVLSGTRCNARGVDLNRNYPTTNWSTDPVYYRNQPGMPQNIALSPGAKPGSESETLALMELIHKLQPELIVSIHGFLGCIDDPDATAVARDMAKRTQMELVPDVGYATPGSFGSWCKERNIPIITYELPTHDINRLKRDHGPIFKDLIIGQYDAMLG